MEWQTKTLSDVSIIQSGSAFPKKYQGVSEEKYPFYKVSDMNLLGNEESLFFENNTISEDTRSILRSPIFPAGSIVFPKVGAAISTNKKRILTKAGCVDNNIMGAIPQKDTIYPRYLYYWFQQHNLSEFANEAALPSIKKTTVEKWPISYPSSIIEQKRIVALLDTVFADLEQTRAKTEQNLKNARELFDSYLQQVFSQQGEGWVETTLGEITGGISTGPFGSLLHKSDYIENGIPLVNPAHIVDQKVVPDTRKTVSEETALRLSAYKMKAGDIVIGRRGEMGRCALITQAEDGYLCGTGSFIIKSSDRCDGRFLVRFLSSASCVANLEKIAGGAVMPNLSNSSLSKFRIRIPSKDKQIEIAKLIDKLSTKMNKVVDIYNKKLDSMDELKQSILQKAFNGELSKAAE